MRERLRAVPSPRSARLGCAPPARVCMADCIKRKLLYLIGLYPALITTNSQSLRTALLAPVTLQNQQAKKKKKTLTGTSVRKKDERTENAGTILRMMHATHMMMISK